MRGKKVKRFEKQAPPNKAFKPFAYGSLGHSALRTCSVMPSAFWPEQALRAECRLTWR